MNNWQNSDSPAQSAGPEGGAADAVHIEKTPSAASETYDWIQCLVSALLICVLVFAFFVRIIGIRGQQHIIFHY